MSAERQLDISESQSSTLSYASAPSSDINALSIRCELLRSHALALEGQVAKHQQQLRQKDQTITRVQQQLATTQYELKNAQMQLEQFTQKHQAELEKYVTYPFFLLHPTQTDKC